MSAQPAVPRVRYLLNGQEREDETGASIADLVRSSGPERWVAVERNGEIVPRDRWPEERIRAGDRIEIVRFVQGG